VTSLLDSCVTAHVHGLSEGGLYAYSPQNMVLPLPETGHRLCTNMAKPHTEVYEPCFGWDVPYGQLHVSSIAVTATV